ncbi:hypothetical protein TIFTF001_048648 [Ficus carica]|uniref:Xyloglucan endo-transglycosylase C-terminal domain-containing protein n=1 Tax=Ficus carica TaxID=3494 RepID=A0AA87Z658_FICCA|nr:hypothetical protein TIFTF001_048622 [Ficus carica]GMN19524.1 hypothetical protein TIFTF001_048625 [Ficus carica]GMN19647.1 hypothetical protein TIFTF001_048645 [Ficus carica]GMN19663.1 hypothetical protein TIFTF001_048648 [Ficus carica]
MLTGTSRPTFVSGRCLHRLAMSPRPIPLKIVSGRIKGPMLWRRNRIRWVQKKFMVYNYCTDFKRFPEGLPLECKRRFL